MVFFAHNLVFDIRTRAPSYYKYQLPQNRHLQKLHLRNPQKNLTEFINTLSGPSENLPHKKKIKYLFNISIDEAGDRDKIQHTSIIVAHGIQNYSLYPPPVLLINETSNTTGFITC
ncbi:MAG: hypothetical protein ACMUEM_05655 [Flavobacteriales bacterium AspAUS03]